MTLPLRRAGAALVVLYALVAVATHLLSDGAGRPLFDGFGPPPPYNWANPPPEFAVGNFPPQSAERIVPLGEAGSEPTNASTPDAQIIIGLPRGALPAHPSDTAVALRIVPRDAGQLGPLPPNFRVVANAYQVTLNYQPSQAPVTSVAQGATVAMTAATQSDTFLYSADGREWRVEPSRPFGATHGLIGGFLGAGYYLVAASPAVGETSGDTDASRGSGPFLAVLAAGAVAGGITFGVVTIRRRRAAAAAAAAKAAARRRKPKPKRNRKGH